MLSCCAVRQRETERRKGRQHVAEQRPRETTATWEEEEEEWHPIFHSLSLRPPLSSTDARARTRAVLPPASHAFFSATFSATFCPLDPLILFLSSSLARLPRLVIFLSYSPFLYSAAPLLLLLLLAMATPHVTLERGVLHEGLKVETYLKIEIRLLDYFMYLPLRTRGTGRASRPSAASGAPSASWAARTS